jgi:hypothetical protein
MLTQKQNGLIAILLFVAFAGCAIAAAFGGGQVFTIASLVLLAAFAMCGLRYFKATT